jgi:predicted O-linked N-acetylglucosamine transferase (SPINDLY family)
MALNARLQAALELFSLGRYPEARARLMPLVAKDPQNTTARLALAVSHLKVGLPAMAALAVRALLQTDALGDSDLATACETLFNAGHAPEAMQFLIAGAASTRGGPVSRATLAHWYNSVGEHHRAASLARENLTLYPEREADARHALANASRALGDHATALENYRALQWQSPDDLAIAQSIAFLSNSVCDGDPQRSYQAHIKYARLIEGLADPHRFEHPVTDEPERTLRVGFVSHDLNNHSVAAFLDAPLLGLRGAGFETVGYSTSPNRDATTERLAPLFSRFEHLPAVRSLDLAKRVHADRIDILVDLNGLTLGHRLHAFQLKPAPVQVTWLGYPNTTGLRAIDCRLVDSTTDPVGADAFAAERLVRIDPCFICYTPPQRRPDHAGAGWTPPAWSPAPHIRFGCFNNTAKVSDAALACWSRVLAMTPGATLTLKSIGLHAPPVQQALQRRLEAASIDPARVTLLPATVGIADHLAVYGEIDIALDTFPYNGTTTTCEALACGVPVVACVGDRHAARVSASILGAAGLHELVAPGADTLAGVAASLAADYPRLTGLRTTLADRFVASPVCDAGLFGRRFADALRDAWRRRCESGVYR